MREQCAIKCVLVRQCRQSEDRCNDAVEGVLVPDLYRVGGSSKDSHIRKTKQKSTSLAIEHASILVALADPPVELLNGLRPCSAQGAGKLIILDQLG